MYRCGDEPLFRLMDVTEMGHVCELVRQSDDPVALGYRRSLADSLRETLLPPIEHFIDRLHETGRGFDALEYPAAVAFRSAVEGVAQNLALSEGGSLDHDVSNELAGELRAAWVEFIAFAAACFMYDTLPQRLEKTHLRNDTLADNAALGGDAKAQRYARPGLDDLIRACLVRHDKPPVKAWVEEYGLGKSAIYARIKAIKVQLEKKPRSP